MFSQWPQPKTGELTIYMLGPGFGESMVLVLPNGEVVVMDCCSDGGSCLTLCLLQHLQKASVELLIVSHPDLDHVQGLDKLLKGVAVKRAWLYPHLHLLRDILRRWGSQQTSMLALNDAWDELDKLRDEDVASTVMYGHMEWSASCGATVSVIAPVEADLLASERRLRKIVEWSSGTPQLAGTMIKRLLAAAPLGDRPNLVSIAVSVSSMGRRVLLGGDVEAPSAPHRGWNGILKVLKRDGRLHLIQQVDVVKVPHHGSRGSVSLDAWQFHQGHPARRVPLAIITPFSKGRSPPPHSESFKHLLTSVERVVLTCDVERSRYTGVGWLVSSRGSGQTSGVVVRLAQHKSPEVELMGKAVTLVR